MKPKDVKKYFKSLYRFNKETGMSASTLGNWLRWGFVPVSAQLKLERITHGILKADWDDKNDARRTQ
jgi:hypothetical protein